MHSVGINIGSTSLKLVLLEDNKIVFHKSIQHEGDFESTIKKIIIEGNIKSGVHTLVTGNEGRFMFNIESTLEPLCIEAALEFQQLKVNAVVSMGGEDLIVYTISNGRIVNSFSGNKCSSGTGEFLRQQLARMDMKLEDIENISNDSKIHPLSTRCSVFMKSDCTHKLNKHEATKHDITLSLCNVMAVKVIDFLKRAKITGGSVILTGGITLNKHILRFIKEKAPNIDFIIPETAHVFEAYGASILAKKTGTPFPELKNLFKNKDIKFDVLDSLINYQDKVIKYKPNISSKNDNLTSDNNKNKKYILGVDGGSTTTKACLIDADTFDIVASHYGRTHGDPIKALKDCLIHIRENKHLDLKNNIKLVATTGSSRELLGVFLQTQGVYNEITAHAKGTTFFDNEVDTIFEIGGQDAKYVHLKNGVPIDYAMNEACSAGTGSFIEESASGDLSINNIEDIGIIALKAKSPLKFGEHCSAFINSDIRKAIQQGATREDITAGIVCSIVSNYLNRVVGNRTVRGKIFLQGGVAKNPAVPIAFAMLLNKEILIPPHPELMGCFGVALLAKQKHDDGLLNETNLDLDELIERNIGYDSIFKCKSCENLCPIQILTVNDKKYMFGGRCNKYTNMRKQINAVPVIDYVTQRQSLLFEQNQNLASSNKKHTKTIGIPRALSVHTLYPLYYWYFNKLGFDTFLSEDIMEEGIARTETEYCFPAEIAHGMVQDCINKNADFILLPHFRDMPSYENDVHANFCPITQALPYYIGKAFPDVDSDKWLPLIVSFKFGEEKAFELFQDLNSKLNINTEESKIAFDFAIKKQKDFFDTTRKLGFEALEYAEKSDKPVIAILGRPYNAFTSDANMGIPLKFTTRGYTVIPFDILPFEDEEIFPNMYWYYGQQVVKAAKYLSSAKNIYVTYITNFSCAPDSFILHYISWIMGQKPFLILELDNHSADAGIDTRIEAFLDIIDSIDDKNINNQPEFSAHSNLQFKYIKTAPRLEQLVVVNNNTQEKINIRNNPKVKVLLSNMGTITTEYMGAALRNQGINTIVLPVATGRTVQIARINASGKECVPNHLVLGSALQFVNSDNYNKDDIYLLFVPITLGPCRTGQYYVFFENLFKNMGITNIVVFILSADNSYTELDANFGKQLWKGLVICDYLKDIQNSLLTTAKNYLEAKRVFDYSWKQLIETVENEPKNIWKQLNVLANNIKDIPLKKKLIDCPKILVVGEIYVRRDDFAISELTNIISDNGIVVKIAGISEWIHYLDFIREYNLKKILGLQKNKFFSNTRKDYILLNIEMLWKKSVEKKVIKILDKTNLIPETHNDMNVIMKYTQQHFLNLELNSEIAVSSGVAATVMENGFSGVVNIAPFACLIGRVIEAIYTPWARDRNYPVISVEIDGYALTPNIINKLNIFIINVLRFKEKNA